MRQCPLLAFRESSQYFHWSQERVALVKAPIYTLDFTRPRNQRNRPKLDGTGSSPLVRTSQPNPIPRPFRAILSCMETLQFVCQPGCTRCCDVQGYVYLSEQDLVRAASHLSMEPADFERRFVYRTRHLLRFRKPRRKQCHFLAENGCRLHPAKPTQCRLFPFWPELLESRSEWQATAQRCPGIGVGPLIQIGTAHETASEMKHAYPSMYDK